MKLCSKCNNKLELVGKLRGTRIKKNKKEIVYMPIYSCKVCKKRELGNFRKYKKPKFKFNSRK